MFSQLINFYNLFVGFLFLTYFIWNVEYMFIFSKIYNHYFEISGVIKARWSDFQVREISKTGEIARLSRFDLPEVKILNKKKQDFQAQNFKFQANKPSF